MTALIDRPHPVDPPAPAGQPPRLDALCSPHAHTARCWWNAGLGGWVCPPSGGRPT